MFGEKIGQGDLASKYPGTWKAWLNRRLDKLVVVRIALAESLKKVWAEHAELGADIEGDSLSSIFTCVELTRCLVTMEHLLVDTDEKVRVAACTVFHDMEFETACHRASVEILKELSGRVTDRKVSLRLLRRIYLLSRFGLAACCACRRFRSSRSTLQFCFLANVRPPSSCL